jgi:hypothetical protein
MLYAEKNINQFFQGLITRGSDFLMLEKRCAYLNKFIVLQAGEA